jgi:poly(A) polymerase/tRNA nucleotidyltransferase (CCA-adding enzyme)
MKHNLQPNTHKLIPGYVTRVIETLEKGGFEAYLVGGCVRDLVIGRIPKDWDVTTNATPEQIQGLFPKTVYENNFGTVAVVFEDNGEVSRQEVGGQAHGSVSHETTYPLGFKLQVSSFIVEITPYRLESAYSDKRHPDAVQFAQTLADDIKRRDFTVNALAMDSKGHITDMFDGLKDIKDKVIRTVGEPADRFNEDALRMLRAIRFSCQLGFVVSYETLDAILKNSSNIKLISNERIRDEFIKIVDSPNPAIGVGFLEKTGLLEYIIPELREGIDCEQGGAHIFDVFTHLIQACQHAADKNFAFHVKLAALFHDIGKPRTRRPGQKKEYTFYGHEVIGARMAQKIMDRLKFPKADTDLVVKLVRYHMFFSDTEQITLSAVRRIIANVGPENIWLLMNIRECDRVGMKKKEAPYRLRKYHAMIEECLRDPISVSQLKIDGNYMIEDMGMKPGPRMGWILHALLEEVLEDPEKNTLECLIGKVKELNQLSDIELRSLGEKARETKEQLDEEEIIKLHAKHGIRK